jgi:hypothetical protein
MSAITTDGTLSEAEAPTGHGLRSAYRRDEEFRAALDRYIAKYNEYQSRRVKMNAARASLPDRDLSAPGSKLDVTAARMAF